MADISGATRSTDGVPLYDPSPSTGTSLDFSDAAFDGYSSISLSRKASAIETKLETDYYTLGRHPILEARNPTNGSSISDGGRHDPHHSRSNDTLPIANTLLHAPSYSTLKIDYSHPRSSAANDDNPTAGCPSGMAGTQVSPNSTYSSLSPPQGSSSALGVFSNEWSFVKYNG